MNWSALFFFNSILFGVGLAMDAFSVSMANGLRHPNMGRSRMCLIAGTFAFFQIIMPLIGWICVHTIAEKFQAVQKYIAWVALILLVWIGGGMIREGLHNKEGGDAPQPVGVRGLLVQGVATSIDALSVGFTIAEYTWPFALVEALIIGAVTFGICLVGLRLGKKFGTLLSGRASILGGLILIAIGAEILLNSLLA